MAGPLEARGPRFCGRLSTSLLASLEIVPAFRGGFLNAVHRVVWDQTLGL